MSERGTAGRVRPTRDLDVARTNLDAAGFCILDDVLPTSLRERLVQRLTAQAKAEAAAAVGFTQDGNTQWVANVLNKGAAFLELLTCAEAPHDLVRHVLGNDYVLSCSNAPIAGPGNARMAMHADQFWTPSLTDDRPEPRLGDIRFANVTKATAVEPRANLFPACMVTLMWTLTDFTVENGATVFVPGSHRSGTQPQHDAAFDEAVAAEAPAGSVILWDGRIWHATGANRTREEHRLGVTQNFVAPMIRPLVNYPYSLLPAVVEQLSEREKELLGFTTWTAYGNEGVPAQRMRYFKPAAEQIGELAPDTPT